MTAQIAQEITPTLPGWEFVPTEVNWTSGIGRLRRLSIYRRDNFTCQSCGWRPDRIPEDYDGSTCLSAGLGGDGPMRILTIDHVRSRFQGGTNHPSNLQVLCLSCNCRKGTK